MKNRDLAILVFLAGGGTGIRTGDGVRLELDGYAPSERPAICAVCNRTDGVALHFDGCVLVDWIETLREHVEPPTPTEERLRAERDRLRKEVVELRGHVAHVFEETEPSRSGKRQVKCQRCDKVTATPTSAYFDPCHGPRIPADDKRKTERFDDGEWTEVDFAELKKGDRFRMFESYGTPVEDGAEWIAGTDAFPTGPDGHPAKELRNPHPTYGISAKRIERFHCFHCVGAWDGTELPEKCPRCFELIGMRCSICGQIRQVDDVVEGVCGECESKQ